MERIINETEESQEQHMSVMSKRKKRTLPILIAWGAVVVLLIGFFITTKIEWEKYLKGQIEAIAILDATKTTYKTTREEKAKYYYFELTQQFPSNFLGMDWSGLNRSTRELNSSLGNLLTALGYECSLGSEYLKSTNYFEFVWNTAYSKISVFVLSGLIVLFGIVTLLYAIDKREIVIEDEFIKARKYLGKTLRFLSKDISTIEKSGKGTLSIRGNGIKYKITRLKNRDELIDAIDSLKTTADSLEAASSESIEEKLTVIKQLLEKGLITKEEFDLKKKQLLDL